VGILRAGAPADFIVLRADPLQDITNIGSIEYVIAAGFTHDPADLRSH
jgi:imidazolonepropionase-like amidohydrolase